MNRHIVALGSECYHGNQGYMYWFPTHIHLIKDCKGKKGNRKNPKVETSKIVRSKPQESKGRNRKNPKAEAARIVL